MSRSVARMARLLIVPALLALGLVAVPTAVAGNPCFHGLAVPAMTTGTDTEIKLAPCAFAPAVTHVAAGSVVTFFNGPTFSHLITGANQEWGSPDVELEPGQTVAYRFDEPGIFPYACALHPGMAGTIVVGDLAGALAADASAGGTTALSGAAGRATDTAGAPPSRTDGAADATTTGSTLPAIALVGSLAAGAGAIVGAALAWHGARRRRRTGEAPAEAR
jgi:plastocyanin